MRKIFNIFIYIFAIIGFLLILMYFSVKLGLTNTKGVVDNQRDHFKNQLDTETPAWVESEEWRILKQAIEKDVDSIKKAGKQVEISPRIIVSILIVEQLRLFNSEREIFKSIFAPLKILGNQNQFSWGVMGIKQETARKIEENLKDVGSPWYLGKEYENLLDFTSNNPNNERFLRLTDEDDRYYSYLYGAILIKQLEKQWEKEGFPIENNVGVLATLFNIGFDNSKPHPNPQTGGAEIEISKTIYSFGGLAKSFYESKELLGVFPREE